MVFYRKYRPQTIEELDSQALREALYAVLKTTEIPHAFLFTGPKGLGKTSTARIMAKAVNCENRFAINNESRTENKKQKGKILSSKSVVQSAESVEPCNQCEQCLSITNGSNLDVMEIDAASNRGIDEMRDLREKLRLAPVSARKKIYIIDEVHMLTTEAFNALLKSLEEPPAHVMFILCTTEPHKVPATIHSRCFHIQFKRATNDELVRSFQRIASSEQITIDPDALMYIASLADGGFRDGVKILEEVAIKADKKPITKAFVEERYHMVNSDQFLMQLLVALSQKDIKKGLQVVTELSDHGIDMKYFLEQLTGALHEALLVQVGLQEGKQAPSLTLSEVKQLVTLVNQAYGELKYAVLPQLPLELLVVTYCQTRIMNNELGIMDKDEKKPRHSGLSRISSISTEKISNKEIATPRQGGSRNDNTNKNQLFGQVIDHVKKQNQSVAGLLRGSILDHIDREKAVFATQYAFHKERLEDPKTILLLSETLKIITGNPLSVSVILKDK